MAGRKRKWSTKVEAPDFKYKRTCDICGKKARFSFIKRGKMRGACRKHLGSI